MYGIHGGVAAAKASLYALNDPLLSINARGSSKFYKTIKRYYEYNTQYKQAHEIASIDD